MVPDRLGVSSIVNAIGNNPYWSNTPIFITWDDWGRVLLFRRPKHW